MLSHAAKTQCQLCRSRSLLNAKVVGQTKIIGSAFLFSLFQASLIYKEFKTHVKISIQCLNYFLDGDLTFLLFFHSQKQ